MYQYPNQPQPPREPDQNGSYGPPMYQNDYRQQPPVHDGGNDIARVVGIIGVVVLVLTLLSFSHFVFWPLFFFWPFFFWGGRRYRGNNRPHYYRDNRYDQSPYYYQGQAQNQPPYYGGPTQNGPYYGGPTQNQPPYYGGPTTQNGPYNYPPQQPGAQNPGQGYGGWPTPPQNPNGDSEL